MSEPQGELEAVAHNELIGQRLRAARESAGMSLREMARRVSLSPSFISQVELGRAAPSIGTLYAIVSELDLSLDAVMTGAPSTASVGAGRAGSPFNWAGPTDTPSVLSSAGDHAASDHAASDHGRTVQPLPEVGVLPGMQRAEERPSLEMRGVRWERLTPTDDPSVEFLRVTYPAGTESCPPDNLMNHGGREYIHILEGRLEVQVAFARQVLRPGDSVNFDSSTPHRLSNPFDEDCVAIWFVTGRHH